ncbi:hypothetical protein HUU05_16780, partial [candidate division KSB1 bacterium]|nr:hypothetical protein [candidate division KSB1 bacterium]
MEINFWETVSSSPTFIILFACSLVAITFILERLLYFRRTNLNSGMFIPMLQNSLRDGGAKAGLDLCQRYQAPLAVVVGVGLQNFTPGGKGVAELIVPDNTRALVGEPDRYAPQLQRTTAEFAQHYGVAILPARP